MKRLLPALFRLKAQSKSWSLFNWCTIIGTPVTILALVFAVFSYFVPYIDLENYSADKSSDPGIRQFTIPMLIRNELSFDVHVDPGLKYFLMSPKTLLDDTLVESGIVRLEQPFGTTAINGNYAIAPNGEMLTQFTLPKSKVIDASFIRGGYKLRVVATNRWVHDYSESIDVLFDEKTLSDGIQLTFYKSPHSR